jgi:hypothetical protein
VRAYVAFLYGRADVGELPGVTGGLRRSLRRSRVRVPPARARRRPRVTRVWTLRSTPAVVQVSATVDDGDVSPYAIVARVEWRDGRWVVTRTVGD